MEEELMVSEAIPLVEVKIEPDLETEGEIPDNTPKFYISGRGRKPKRKRGRPANKNKFKIKSEEVKELSVLEENDAKSLKGHTVENFSIKLEKVDSYEMVGKLERKKLLDAMSAQFNSEEISEPPRLIAARKGKRGGRGKSLKRECPEDFLQPADLDEASSSIPKKKDLGEDLSESPSIEEDLQDVDNELEFPELQKSRGSKRGRPQSLENSFINRTRNLVGSQSPVTGKESPISESSNDSANSRSRGRLRQAIAEEISSLNESKQLTSTSGGKRGRGRISILKSGQVIESKKSNQNTELAPFAKNTTGRIKKSEIETNGSVTIPQNITLKTCQKKKKKHFKGLRYSFGLKKKKPKPKWNQVHTLFDSSLDNESLISEEVDGDSFDSSSIETSSAPMSTGLDPYDPTEEFDDSQAEKKELSFHQQRLQNKDLGEPPVEEDNLEVEEEQSWNTYPEDDEAYIEDCIPEDQEETYSERQCEEAAEDMADNYQEVNEFISNQEEEYIEDIEEQEEMLEEDEDRQYEEEEPQFEDPDANQEYGELLQEEYEEEDVPIDYDVEGNEEAIANGIEYMDDTHEGIEGAIAYENEQNNRELEYEETNGILVYDHAERSLEYDNQLNEYNEEFDVMQMEYVEEPMESAEDEPDEELQQLHDDQQGVQDDQELQVDQQEVQDNQEHQDDQELQDDQQQELQDDQQQELQDDQQEVQNDQDGLQQDLQNDEQEIHNGEQDIQNDDQDIQYDDQTILNDDQDIQNDEKDMQNLPNNEHEIQDDQPEVVDKENEIEDSQQESDSEESVVDENNLIEDEHDNGDDYQDDTGKKDVFVEQLKEIPKDTETVTTEEGIDSDSKKMLNIDSFQEMKVMEDQPFKWRKKNYKHKKVRKVKAKKYKKPIWNSLELITSTSLMDRKRKHSDNHEQMISKKTKIIDEEMSGIQHIDEETSVDMQESTTTFELPRMENEGDQNGETKKDLEPIKSFEDNNADTSQQTREKQFHEGDPGINIIVEEDSTDTSEGSMNIKNEKQDCFSRRISKRRNGDSVPDPVDDKGDVRKTKRLNTLSSSGVLTIAARSDGKSYPKLVEEMDQDVANSNLKNALCKCRVNLNPKAVNVIGEAYCQGFDCFDGRMIGCCNIVANDTFLRVSPKIPFMLLCNIHRQRLRRHNCCPGCGLFCTQGLFAECRWDQDGIRHYYHKLCGLLVNGVALCPHCGTSQPPLEVHLELKLSRKPVIYLKQHQEKKGLLSSARMTCPTSKAVNETGVDEKSIPSDVTQLALPNGSIITSMKLSTGIKRDRLDDAIKSINCGKTFNIKASPKAIYWACKFDDLEKLLWVLVSGLSPNAKVREYGNQTGLHTAAMYGSIASAHVLVLAGACFDLTDTQLLTPLMVAITKGHNDLVSYLIQAGANLHARTDDGMTCLHLAAKAGNYQSCKHILDSGRLSRHTINVQDEGGWTPLVWASENRCITVVKLLLDRGADPQICDVEQNTALHWAAFSGSTHICSMVLERGCSLKSMNGIGDTPLHIAARQNHVEVVAQLLARGSNLDVTNKRNQSPLECCLPESESFLHITLNKKLLQVMRDNGIRTERILCSDIACGKETVPITCVNGCDSEELPQNYVYISENCEALNVNIDRTISSLKWCECKDGCNTENCVCSQLNFQCWYDPEGKLLVDFNYLDPPMIFECNRACGCNKLSCHNRVVQHGITAHMQLFKTEGKGWGVRALKDITKGSYVCEYVGEIITDLEADQREDDSYLFDLDNRDTETYCIDARQYANIARFINHLCEPNLTPVKVFIDHQDLVFPRIAFFANRDIEADEELGFDYGEKFWVIKYKQFTCTCSSEKCKYSTDTIQGTLEAYNKKIQVPQQQDVIMAEN